MGILSWMLMGLLAGAVAKALMPGQDRGGCLVTMLIGMAGAVVGGWIGSRLGLGGVGGFDWRSLGLALAGSLVVLAIFRLMFGTRREKGDE